MKILEKSLLLDVFDAYGRDATTGKFLFANENLTSSSIKGTSEATEVNNGRGNALFAKIGHSKKITIDIATNTFDYEQLATMAGTTVSDTVEGVTYCAPQTITCSVAGKIELSETPIASANIEVFKDGASVVIGAVTGKDVVVASAVIGDKFKVLPYEVAFISGEAEVIDIKTDTFPENIELILKGVEKNNKGKVVAELTWVFDSCAPSADFEMSTASKSDPAESTITFEAVNVDGSLAKCYRKVLV